MFVRFFFSRQRLFAHCIEKMIDLSVSLSAVRFGESLFDDDNTAMDVKGKHFFFKRCTLSIFFSFAESRVFSSSFSCSD